MKVVKNGRSKAYAMDGAALEKIFEKRGIDPRQFGEELGYHRTYFPKCIHKNCIGEKAIGMLMSKKILPSQYGVEIKSLTKETRKEFHIKEAEEIAKLGGLENAEKVRFRIEEAEEIAKLGEEAVNEATDKKDWLHYDGVKKNSGRYPWGEEKSPAEKAMEEPGVVKVEFTLDIVKLKAIVKQAVKEAYEEL